MIHRQLTLLLLAVICSSLFTIFYPQNTYARDWGVYTGCKAKSGSGGSIYAHDWACGECADGRADSVVSTIWISGSKADGVGGKFSNKVLLEGNVAYAPIYIFGDVFTCKSSWGQPMFAINVYTNKPEYIKLDSSSLYRGKANTIRGEWNYNLGGASSYISGTIDINKFKEIASCDNNNQCSDTVWIYRCPSNNGSSIVGDCDWAKSDIVVDFSQATQDRHYSFIGSNRAYIGNEDYTDGGIYYSSDENTQGSFKYGVTPNNHHKLPKWCSIDGSNKCDGPWNSSTLFVDDHKTFTVKLGEKKQFCKTLTYYQTFVERVSTLNGGVVRSWYENPANITACVTIDHKYNYKTTPSVNFGNPNTPLYGGDPSPAQVIPAIKNTPEDTSRPSTQTELGDIQVAQLIVPHAKQYNQHAITGTGDEDSDTTTTQSLCTFYNKLTNQCSILPTPESYKNIVIGTGFNNTWSGGPLDLTIPDYPVGTKVCVAVGFKPAKSSANQAWRISGTSCRPVAKKPHYQVWGGNLYTAGNITTSNTIKRINHVNYLFGSWAEYALVARGAVRGLSSGATTGYTGAYNTQGGKTLGDSTDEAFCSRSPLTIANTNCSSHQDPTTGHSGVHYDNSTADRIISRFAKAPTDPPPTHITPCTEPRCVSYTSVTGDLIIPSAPTLQKGVTHVIYATGNITINTNILTSPSNTTFNHISEVPQYIIISNKDIRIAPHVTRVDSWLVTRGGTINTCYNHLIGSSDPATSLSSSVCNSQLRINGPILTKSITPHRTYGSDQGFSATPPAEIFNLPPTTYFWAYHQSTSHSQAFTTYLKELSPRY